MIILDNKKNLDFVKIGLFDTVAEWIHPTVKVNTYELIYVVAGNVHLFEGDTRYSLTKGEAILLEPGKVHGGFQSSTGRTSFYWLHFYTDDISAWDPVKHQALPATAERSLREIMHHASGRRELAELAVARFLLELKETGERGDKLAFEVREYIRIHAAEPLRVGGLARKFGYSGDHLSRIYRREFGHDLKEGITRGRMLYIESLLVNTDYTVKEIAEQCGFADENLFTKFFKYHAQVTPSDYRNRFFRINMNVK